MYFLKFWIFISVNSAASPFPLRSFVSLGWEFITSFTTQSIFFDCLQLGIKQTTDTVYIPECYSNSKIGKYFLVVWQLSSFWCLAVNKTNQMVLTDLYCAGDISVLSCQGTDLSHLTTAEKQLFCVFIWCFWFRRLAACTVQEWQSSRFNMMLEMTSGGSWNEPRRKHESCVVVLC